MRAGTFEAGANPSTGGSSGETGRAGTQETGGGGAISDQTAAGGRDPRVAEYPMPLAASPSPYSISDPYGITQ